MKYKIEMIDGYPDGITMIYVSNDKDIIFRYNENTKTIWKLRKTDKGLNKLWQTSVGRLDNIDGIIKDLKAGKYE